MKNDDSKIDFQNEETEHDRRQGVSEPYFLNIPNNQYMRKLIEIQENQLKIINSIKKHQKQFQLLSQDFPFLKKEMLLDFVDEKYDENNNNRDSNERLGSFNRRFQSDFNENQNFDYDTDKSIQSLNSESHENEEAHSRQNNYHKINLNDNNNTNSNNNSNIIKSPNNANDTKDNSHENPNTKNSNKNKEIQNLENNKKDIKLASSSTDNSTNDISHNSYENDDSYTLLMDLGKQLKSKITYKFNTSNINLSFVQNESSLSDDNNNENKDFQNTEILDDIYYAFNHISNGIDGSNIAENNNSISIANYSDSTNDSDNKNDYDSGQTHIANQKKKEKERERENNNLNLDSKEKIEKLKLKSTKKIKSQWNSIIKKYSSYDLNNQGDLVDIFTGEIVEDNGHLKSIDSKNSNLWKLFSNKQKIIAKSKNDESDEQISKIDEEFKSEKNNQDNTQNDPIKNKENIELIPKINLNNNIHAHDSYLIEDNPKFHLTGIETSTPFFPNKNALDIEVNSIGTLTPFLFDKNNLGINNINLYGIETLTPFPLFKRKPFLLKDQIQTSTPLLKNNEIHFDLNNIDTSTPFSSNQIDINNFKTGNLNLNSTKLKSSILNPKNQFNISISDLQTSTPLPTFLNNKPNANKLNANPDNNNKYSSDNYINKNYQDNGSINDNLVFLTPKPITAKSKRKLQLYSIKKTANQSDILLMDDLDLLSSSRKTKKTTPKKLKRLSRNPFAFNKNKNNKKLSNDKTRNKNRNQKPMGNNISLNNSTVFDNDVENIEERKLSGIPQDNDDDYESTQTDNQRYNNYLNSDEFIQSITAPKRVNESLPEFNKSMIDSSPLKNKSNTESSINSGFSKGNTSTEFYKKKKSSIHLNQELLSSQAISGNETIISNNIYGRNKNDSIQAKSNNALFNINTPSPIRSKNYLKEENNMAIDKKSHKTGESLSIISLNSNDSTLESVHNKTKKENILYDVKTPKNVNFTTDNETFEFERETKLLPKYQKMKTYGKRPKNQFSFNKMSKEHYLLDSTIISDDDSSDFELLEVFENARLQKMAADNLKKVTVHDITDDSNFDEMDDRKKRQNLSKYKNNGSSKNKRRSQNHESGSMKKRTRSNIKNQKENSTLIDELSFSNISN
ncbi:uncharacterized protein ASCRUDRAFT_14891 [Ascoidea rubescens DSM 1968]|uniref:Uncharacterized protein n=1 Tax=Ascoidea rubescens DSM 1968 TaxID=1344418 RepID=A0A1D2VCN6_9ASCO|nr:hypothetical protein ASCRUDRAFT_14891 [Ascoidea rubescens DSM 1968]ODV59484.1 hypothetical protein ASCRUDRAFT_14891 [Ascoidea rubescens DSM 1968]